MPEISEKPNFYKPETWSIFSEEMQAKLLAFKTLLEDADRCGTCLHYVCTCGEDF